MVISACWGVPGRKNSWASWVKGVLPHPFVGRVAEAFPIHALVPDYLSHWHVNWLAGRVALKSARHQVGTLFYC